MRKVGYRVIIFGFLRKNLKAMGCGGRGVQYGAGESWVQGGAGEDRARALLAGFRRELYWCLGRRADALFEVADALLCQQDRVHMLAELSLEPECRRGHGAVYDAVNCGQVQIGRLRRALAGLPLPPGRTGGSGWRRM